MIYTFIFDEVVNTTRVYYYHGGNIVIIIIFFFQFQKTIFLASIMP